ncbi:MAG: hypothetical protein CM1200mP36_03310 [Gammaproteobacteria bacterium]|nr:MAG: hypothetical protein CM1200mP36_03310 [Gammaproteobacteria bacterium]
MKLYYFPGAPSPLKVGIVISEKGLEIPTIVVNLRSGEHRTEEFAATHPEMTLPVLELDDGTRITESLAIVHYLEQTHPEPNLMGVDAREQALVLMWCDICALQGYLGIQERFRNSSDFPEGRALPGPVSYDQIAALVDRGDKRIEAFFEGSTSGWARVPISHGPLHLCGHAAFVYLGFAERVTGQDPAEGREHVRRWADEIKADLQSPPLSLMIRYTVRLADLNRHHFEVLCHIENPGPTALLAPVLDSRQLSSEGVRPAHRQHWGGVRGAGDRRRESLEGYVVLPWRDSSLSVTIEVYALDRSFRGPTWMASEGISMGPVCSFVLKGGPEPVEVLLETPCDPRCESWRVATAMVAKDVDQNGFGLYRAENYDELIDHPVEMSDFSDGRSNLRGASFLVIAGRHRTDLQRIASDLTQLWKRT